MTTSGPRPARTSLLLASTNPSKQQRLRWVFEGLGLQFRSIPSDAGPPPEELGSTFRENAELKAQFWSGRLGGLVAASDGGLTIPALGKSWDPLRTARAAGADATDAERARWLLNQARDLDGSDRAALWTEGLALARDGRQIASWQSSGTEAVLLEGFQAEQLRPGFWAASLCYVPGLGTTLAELTDEQLGQADPTWSRLRALVVSFFRSGQADLNLLT